MSEPGAQATGPADCHVGGTRRLEREKKLTPPLGLPQRGGRLFTRYPIIYLDGLHWPCASGAKIARRQEEIFVPPGQARRRRFSCSLLTSEKSRAPLG